MIAPLILALAAALPADVVGDVPYVKLDTREATRAAMLKKLVPEEVTWGTWYQCSPFPYAGHGKGDLATAWGPEAELAKMRRGEAPDLGAVYAGKKGVEARWVERGPIAGERVDLHTFDDPDLMDFVACYLYVAVESPREQTVEFTMGSDDGLRVWLNGELIHDKDVPRGLNPDEDRVRFHFFEGANDVLFEIVDGVAGWEFQINTRKELDSRLDAQLQYYLDRDFPPSREREHYRVFTVPLPRDVVLEVGGLDVLPDGRPAVATRRGDVYLVDGAYAEPPTQAKFQRFAEGLHEPLGLVWRDGGLYTVQRGELTHLVDVDGDEVADRYDAFCDDWGVSGNYHEFAFGPKFDRDGNAWVTLNVGFCGALGKSIAPWRGWTLRIRPDGTMEPWCDGMRSPNGIGMWKDGEMFYVDNQGDYVATNRVTHLAKGTWHGHPAGLRWRDDVDNASDARPPRERASVWLPYKKMGQSTADLVLETTGGKFGPFGDQFFAGDQTLALVVRIDMEEVNGHYQGACFPFLEGLDCGVNRLAFGPDGSLFVGETDRGWGSVGRRRYGLQRVVYTGEVPFEVKRMTARSDGFELEFTEDVDLATAGDAASYALTSYTYEYHEAYGAPEDDTQPLAITQVDVVGTNRVRLHVDPLRKGYVHELHYPGVRNLDGEEPLHDVTYYTLEEIPPKEVAEVRGTRTPRVLFLTHSAGFVHDVVKRPAPDQLALAEQVLVDAARGRFEVVPTQDCARLAPESLADFDAVVFYTTGELPIPAEHRAALLDWVADGHAFVGIHCATDTFYEYPPYQEMVGGIFDGHPWHEPVVLAVEDPTHPATDHLGARWELTDEIYQFRGFHRFPNHVLLHLTGEKADLAKGKRADGDYANAWCKPWGRGRVFYTALGHRPEVWRDARFTEHLVDGIGWALDGPDVSPPPPAGAVALMPGDAKDAWCHGEGRAAAWDVANGVWTVHPGAGNLFTKERYADGLYHVEFSPSVHGPEVTGQGRGNSGVYLMGQYELQVLDSYGLEPQLGDCGACYGVALPLVAPYRPPGEWSSYDIEFTAPRFDANGEKTANARITAWLNGRLIHDDIEVPGPTAGAWRGDEFPMGPLMLQDHGNPVRFRNVWVLPRHE
ncbi:MAG: ThuA domain-containing protein [Planctomycetes bacterium]|nr:ThuA domain-containing protein [Planctomycetota bacterium]